MSFKDYLTESGPEFDYMLLSRLQQDNEYFLGAGNGNEKVLWAGNVKDQIKEMKKLWKKVKEKPDWISMKDIEKYEKEMVKKLKSSINEAKIPTVGTVKKLLKSIDFDFIYPEFFDVEKKNTDAGMGGYDYIQITYDVTAAKSSKRAGDVFKALGAITDKYKNADVKAGLIIIK